jgi:hypothetical protein
MKFSTNTGNFVVLGGIFGPLTFTLAR